MDTNARLINKVLLPDSNKSQKVLGMPPRFLDQTDPGQDTFLRTLAYNAPIVTMMPGQPMNNTKKMAELKDLIVAQNNNVQSNNIVTIRDVKQFINEASHEKRVFRFEQANADYLNVFNSMASRMYSRIKRGNNLLDWKDLDARAMADFGGFNFWAHGDTSITEQISSDFQEGIVESIQTQMTKMVQELNRTLGAAGGLTGTSTEGLKIVQEQGAAANSASMAWAGTQVLLPKMWNGSQMTKTYSLQFKFEQLYGDEDSLINDVYLPFLALLALALPRSTPNSVNMYQEPFLVRAYCPGYFIIDMGVITNMTIKKTSGDDTWNYRGITQMIEVTLDITDLYPVMISSPNTFLLDANDTMSYYLDALTGVTYKNLKSDGTLREMIQELSVRSAAGVGQIAQIADAYVNNTIATASSFFRYR